jgi:phage protein D
MAEPGSTPAFISARPNIRVENRDMPELSEAILSLLVEETGAGMSRCEAAFGNWGAIDGEVDFLYFDRELFDFGKTLAFEAGEEDAAGRLFKGRITGMEAQYPADGELPAFLVLAEDALQDLRMTRRSRSFEDTGDREVFEQIASEHGLRADLDIDGPTYRVLTQVNQSDLAFLRGRARAIDARLWVEDQTLYARDRAGGGDGDVTLTYPAGLKEFSVSADLAGQCTAFVMGGWDSSGKEAIACRVTDAVINGELQGLESGSGLLNTAFGERVEQVVHPMPPNLEEAQRLAEAGFRERARRFVTGSGYTDGDARIHVGAALNLEGLGTMFNGRYYTTEVRHTFDGKNGFRTYFRVERPGIEPA